MIICDYKACISVTITFVAFAVWFKADPVCYEINSYILWPIFLGTTFSPWGLCMPFFGECFWWERQESPVIGCDLCVSCVIVWRSCLSWSPQRHLWCVCVAALVYKASSGADLWTLPVWVQSVSRTAGEDTQQARIPTDNLYGQVLYAKAPSLRLYAPLQKYGHGWEILAERVCSFPVMVGMGRVWSGSRHSVVFLL